MTQSHGAESIRRFHKKDKHPVYNLYLFHGQCVSDCPADRHCALYADVAAADDGRAGGESGCPWANQPFGGFLSAHNHEAVRQSVLRSHKECGSGYGIHQ